MVLKTSWFRSMKKIVSKVCLVAVDIRSAHNIGSIFRTCDGFAAELYLVGITPRPIFSGDERLPHISLKADKEIAKTALGAEQTVKWRYESTFQKCIETLRREGYTIYGIEQDLSSRDIRELKIEQNVALVLGREVEGLSKSEKALCDELFEIKMYGNKESFNVSVAAGIALYQTTL